MKMLLEVEYDGKKFEGINLERMRECLFSTSHAKRELFIVKEVKREVKK